MVVKCYSYFIMKGGWENDETVEEAAVREAVEEAGVRGELLVRMNFFVYYAILFIGVWIIFVNDYS